MSPCAASPGEIRSTLLTLDLTVATQILMQLAVRDIGQVTDIQGLAGIRIPGYVCRSRQRRRTCPFLTRQTRTPLSSHPRLEAGHGGQGGHAIGCCHEPVIADAHAGPDKHRPCFLCLVGVRDGLLGGGVPRPDRHGDAVRLVGGWSLGLAVALG
jgi:hypothetical protein